MNRFEMRVDPLTHEIYYSVPLKGYALMHDPLLNKGHAFGFDERLEFDLVGLLPDPIGSIEDQIERNYEIYKNKDTDLGRYIALMALQDRNETVFYALLTQHLEEMLPIVYTPTVGQACLKLSHMTRQYRGLYVTQQNVNNLEQMLVNVGLPNISLIVVTDGERILGLGDLGADGMGIPVGKISLYVAAAGIHPASTLPICLDVGTNNERLLNDPLYLGIRKPRLSGDAYYEVVERFVQGVKRTFPNALVQWEDFGKQNAFGLLETYKHRILSFNDDIQGTGATAAAALRTAFKITGTKASEHRIGILGFGQAGSGVANAICNLMAFDEGLPVEECRRRIYALDMPGLLLEGMKVEPYQRNFLQPREAIAEWPIPKDRAPNLAEVVKHARITTVIGLAAQPGAFDEPLLRQLAENTPRPIVMALSNPTSKCEATPEQVLRVTNGRALVATGSPSPPCPTPDGRTLRISQCNNLYIFPGTGLGAIVAQATRVSALMFQAASRAVSELVSDEQLCNGELLPPLADIRRVSFHVALAVARQAREEGIGIKVSDDRLASLIYAAMWEPHYYPYRYQRDGH